MVLQNLYNHPGPAWATMPSTDRIAHMYTKSLRHAGHTRRFEIREAGGVWEALARHDDQVVKQARYDDWHRVERTLHSFSTEVSNLEQAGWVLD